MSSIPDPIIVKFGLNDTDTVPVAGSNVLGLTATISSPVGVPGEAAMAWKSLNWRGPQVIVGDPTGGSMNVLLTVATVIGCGGVQFIGDALSVNSATTSRISVSSIVFFILTPSQMCGVVSFFGQKSYLVLLTKPSQGSPNAVLGGRLSPATPQVKHLGSPLDVVSDCGLRRVSDCWVSDCLASAAT